MSPYLFHFFVIIHIQDKDTYNVYTYLYVYHAYEIAKQVEKLWLL